MNDGEFNPVYSVLNENLTDCWYSFMEIIEQFAYFTNTKFERLEHLPNMYRFDFVGSDEGVIEVVGRV
ncbi:hypothetical protein C1E23_16220 [Pseudoalteromonas phenolica]|uniref:Uncharacterized protein n=1 Tax=Pseudoalteromonas phenolica TaxID=161398 RepID=A0A4Q7IK80_9GAMM|nr:hypothetical protein C1E23_16220 [Pseudoalteromonas phenolica]